MFLTLTKRFNQWVGPFILRQGLRARLALGGGVMRDNPFLDAMVGLPLAQRLISLEVHEESKQAVEMGTTDVSWTDFWLHRKGEQQVEDDSIMSAKAKKGMLSLDDEAKMNVAVLEKYLRPVLVRHEIWSDVQAWQLHHRIIKWARREYLLAKYGPHVRAALQSMSALRQSPQLSSRRKMVSKVLAGNLMQQDGHDSSADDDWALTKLPSTSLVLAILDMQEWNQRKEEGAVVDSTKRNGGVCSGINRPMAKVVERLGGHVLQLRAGAFRLAVIPPDADLSKLSLEDILEAAGGHVATCGPLNALCEQADMYQLWTQEYVEGLGSYLWKRSQSFAGDTIVLDVGAGDGMLAQLLREYFEVASSSSEAPSPKNKRKQQKGSPRRQRGASVMSSSTDFSRQPNPNLPMVVATDDGSWRIFQKATVERLNYEKAISKYAANDGSKQVIVLCSWMPMDEDWSSSFRRDGAVDEYILIGESDDGQCGDNWKTWGNLDFLSQLEASHVGSPVTETPIHKDAAGDLPRPPYEAEGYVRRDLKSLHRFQFSRFDCSASKFGKTVSFRRKK